MSRSRKIIVFSLAFALSVTGAVLVWKAAHYAALLSCVRSTGNDVVEYGYLELGHLRELEHGDAGEVDRWYVLSEEEAARVLSTIPRGNCNFRLEPPADMETRKFKIAIHNLENQSFEVRVWSNGFDNIPGTNDDIVFPYGEKALPGSY